VTLLAGTVQGCLAKDVGPCVIPSGPREARLFRHGVWQIAASCGGIGGRHDNSQLQSERASAPHFSLAQRERRTRGEINSKRIFYHPFFFNPTTTYQMFCFFFSPELSWRKSVAYNTEHRDRKRMCYNLSIYSGNNPGCRTKIFY